MTAVSNPSRSGPSPSIRSQVLFRRTYARPKDDGSFESWEETCTRVIAHQRWLWERVLNRKLNDNEQMELYKLFKLMDERKCLMSGRTLWLGGTEVAKRREASQFNCAFTKVETINDCVDVLWLLLQGCGVGFMPVPGTLNGFTKPLTVETIRSQRTAKGGIETNKETWDAGTKTWTIRIGDSAEAWAKSIGKLLAGKYPAEKLVLDLTEIRPAGERLSGYGWISSGDASIARAYEAICGILNDRAGQLLTRINILDIVNWLGTILSSRRSAEIALVEYGGPEWADFATAKHDCWTKNPQRAQSNNSLVFTYRPSEGEITSLLNMMVKAGGSEPGFINAQAALKRAPWFSGVNPCAEILLGNKCFCNLTEVDVAKFTNLGELEEAIRIISRANYRQTLVNLNDGILQPMWHQNNEYLRLCGVGLTGLCRAPNHGPYEYRRLRNAAVAGTYSMADELGTQRPKNVTTVKPSGTLSKIMDTTEGVHKPLGRYIFNNVTFGRHDPLVAKMQLANYRVIDHPTDPESVLITFPVDWSGVPFEMVNGKEVNRESALLQLYRYKLLMDNYVDQNCSVTISYSVEEVPGIARWIHDNWDSYVGVSFIFRNDPTKTAKDLGYLYLPHEVVSKDTFDDYVKTLKLVDLEGDDSSFELKEQECAGGACPIK